MVIIIPISEESKEAFNEAFNELLFETEPPKGCCLLFFVSMVVIIGYMLSVAIFDYDPIFRRFYE